MEHPALPRTARSRARRGGFTLVEIAIALAIFVFGALAIIRIFPPAFSLIQNSGSRSIANHLARSTLSKFNSEPALAPDAIYADDSGGWTDYPWPVAGTVKDGSLPQDLQASITPTNALATFRHIVGERHKVRNDANGNPFIFTQFPCWDLDADASTVTVYSEDTVNGVTVDAVGQLNFTNATLASTGAAFNDAVNTNITRPPNTYRYDSADTTNQTTFYLTYAWLENSRVQKVIDEPLRYRTNAIIPVGAVEQVGESYKTGVTIVPGTISMRYRKRLTITAPSKDQAMVGLVNLSGSGLTAGNTASVDYTVSSWDWLVEDSAVSPVAGGSTGTVTLPVRHITDEGSVWYYTLLTGTNSSGATLTRQNAAQTAGNQSPSYYNGSGAGIASGTSPLVVSSSPDSRNTERKEARITFDLTYLITTSGYSAPRARTSYQSLDNWGHQVAVAAKSYVPYETVSYPVSDPTALNAHPSELWRSYLWSYTNEPETLYFHASEAGKSILVTYEYQNGGTYSTTSTIVTIDEDLVTLPVWATSSFVQTTGSPAPNPTGLVAKAQLIAPNGSVLPATAIKGVQGASVEARTVFVDNNRYTQAAVFGFRPM